MATKVHDQGDEQDFAEVDAILAQAKQELIQSHRERCRDRRLRRNVNLSDIPEHFALVPSCTPGSELSLRSNMRPVSLDTSQPDFASRDRDRDRDRDRGWERERERGRSRDAAAPSQGPKLPMLGMMARMKWLRGYMGCVMVAQDPAAAPEHHRHHGFSAPAATQPTAVRCFPAGQSGHS